MPLAPTGKFTKRIVILPVDRESQGDNGEEIGRWPEGSGVSYFAAVESFGANEVVGQGQSHATGTKRLRIRGRAIAVTTADKVQDKVTGELFHVTGVAREDHDTILDVSRVVGQEVNQ